jgi:hypothetical protein
MDDSKAIFETFRGCWRQRGSGPSIINLVPACRGEQ